MQVRYCGLGRHTTVAGGPVGPEQLVKFYKVSQPYVCLAFTGAI